MSGYLPFQGQSRNEVFSKISKGKYHFNHVEFKVCSKEVLDLISKMLVVDPNRRITATDAMKHPWFKKIDETKGN